MRTFQDYLPDLKYVFILLSKITFAIFFASYFVQAHATVTKIETCLNPKEMQGMISGSSIATLQVVLANAEENNKDLLAINQIRAKLGCEYFKANKIKEALQILIPATEFYQTHTDKFAYASTLHILGKAWRIYGANDKSILALAKSVAIFSELDPANHENLAMATIDLAKMNIIPGFLELARIHANNALEICEQANPKLTFCSLQAKSIIGDVNLEASDAEVAVEIFQMLQQELKNSTTKHIQFSLEIEAKLKQSQASLQNTKAARLEALHAYQNLLHYYVSNGANDSLETGLTLNQIADLYLALGEHDSAIKTVQESIRIIEKQQGKASTTLLAPTINYAKAYQQKGDVDQMLEYIIHALGFISDDISFKSMMTISDMLTNYSKSKNNPQAAVHFSKRTVAIALQSGANLRLSNPQLGRNYLAKHIYVFREVVENLFRQGRLVEAQDALDLLKANEYLDFTGEVGDEMRQAERNKFEEKTRLAFNLEMYNYVHAVERANLARHTLTDNHANKQIQNTRQQEYALRDHIQQMFETFRQQEPTEIPPPIENITRTQSKVEALKKIDSPTVTLQYVVAKDKLYILLGSSKSLLLKEVNIDESALQNAVHEFLDTVQNPSQDPFPKATKLYQLLIQPVAADLQRLATKTILISPDSFLKQVPFAALHNGKQYLIQKYDLALLTPSTLVDAQQSTQKNYEIAAFGLSNAVNGFRALPGVKDELSKIIKHDRFGIFPGEINLDAAFTEEALEKTLAKHYPVLHIASHFAFNPGRDTDSFLILGDGKALSINQLKQKKFDFSNTDLIVLSACDTARYGKNQNDIPVDGLANVLQLRGAKSIVATLWAVEDKSTSILIPQFYRNLATHYPKIIALSDAQRHFIEQDFKVAVTKNSRGIRREFLTSNFKTNPKRPYAHPYFWAGFTLIGNIN